jgi:50S ribosomal protein L16 3-hydroxylase
MIEINATKKYFLGMPANEFLRDYWQKKPLLIRQALPDYQAPLSPEDLAGIACEQGVLARLIKHDRKKDHYSVKTGPFDEAMFPKLGKKDWTLLVQDMDKWDADIGALLEPFNFLPRWRIDDVMISFATPGGSVGPHVDQYDVFLLQGYGQRRWEIDTDQNADKRFRENTELKLLQSFTPSIAWTLQPGDMLYLPPGVPHHGEAVDACMTFSIGMRAPSQAELLSDFADSLLDRLNDDERYSDQDLISPKDPGEIDKATAQRVLDIFRMHQPDSNEAAAAFFGRFITRYRNAMTIAAPPKTPSVKQILEKLDKGYCLTAHPFARWAWSRDGKDAVLYVQGDAFASTHAVAALLARAKPINADMFASIPSSEHALIFNLVERGYLVMQKFS